jgi:putative ABC transport system permease protein
MLTTFPAFAPLSLALRNMRSRRWRTLLTVSGIILGVSVVLAVNITNQSTLDAIRQVFDRATGRASLLVVPNEEADSGIDEDILAKLQDYDGIQVVAPSLHTQTVLASEATSYQVNFNITGVASGSFLQIFGMDPELDPQVRVYVLASGRLPADGQYETALPVDYAEEKGLDLGDDLVIVSPQGIVRLDIVGLLIQDGIALANDGVIAFVPLSVVQEIFDRQGEVDEIALRLDPTLSGDSRALEGFKQSLQEGMQEGNLVIYPAARGRLVSQMLATYQQGLTFFSIIAVFVGAFLVYNTFSMTVVERTREIGMLRAIGFDRLQVIRMVLAEASLLSIAGSSLGMLGGVALARGLMDLMGTLVNGDTGLLSVPANGLLLAVFVGFVVTLGAALVPALQAAHISPLEALRARARNSGRARPALWLSGLALIAVGWLAVNYIPWRPEALLGVGIQAVLSILIGATLTVPLIVAIMERVSRPIVTLIYQGEGALGSANIHRSLGRTALTVASMMVALTMVIGFGSLAYSFEEDITSWIDTALGGDLYVRSAIPMRESFARQLSNIPGVAAITPARYIDVRIAPSHLPPSSELADILAYNAIDPATYRQVSDIQFATGQGDLEANWARLAQGNALFVSTTVADRYGIHQGDSLWLNTRRGAQPFYVAAEIIDFTGQGQVVVGTFDDLHRWFAEHGVNRYTVLIKPGYSVDEVASEIEAQFSHRNISAQTTEIFKGKIRNLMRQSFKLFDVLTLIGVIIGALGVINTLIMNVIERQREIGGLRSLGMTRGQVLRMILAESLAMGIIGGCYGLAFGYVVAQLLILGINLINGYELVYLFTARPFVTGMVIALIVSQLAALYPARSAASFNIVEAIKHE